MFEAAVRSESERFAEYFGVDDGAGQFAGLAEGGVQVLDRGGEGAIGGGGCSLSFLARGGAWGGRLLWGLGLGGDGRFGLYVADVFYCAGFARGGPGRLSWGRLSYAGNAL